MKTLLPYLKNLWPFREFYHMGLVDRSIPCLLDEDDVEYIVVKRYWQQLIIRPFTRITAMGDVEMLDTVYLNLNPRQNRG